MSIATADNNPQPAGFKAYIAAFTLSFSLNFSKNLVTEITIMYEGKTTANVAITEPKIPATVYPAKVATLTPTGPGVTDDSAIISDSCCDVYQGRVSAIWYKNGIVA